MQQLFSVAKIPVFLDTYAPGLEKRPVNEQIKVLTMTLRVSPFDAKLATAIDDGVGEDSNVRATLFKLGNPDVKPHVERVNFSLGCPRQNLIIFATPDSPKARIGLLQVKIAGTYARTQKDRNGYDWVFRASVGPVGREEQEFLHDWYRTQRFVTFEQAEPMLETEDGGDGDDEPGEGTQAAAGEAEDQPLWQAEDDKRPAARRPMPRHSNRKDVVKAKQAKGRVRR